MTTETSTQTTQTAGSCEYLHVGCLSCTPTDHCPRHNCTAAE